MDFKTILKYVAIGGAVYLVYTYVIAPMMGGASTALPAGTSTAGAGAATGTTTITASPVITATPPVTSTAATVNNTLSSSDYGSTAWQARVASAMAIAAGGNGNQNFDNWSWFYQNSVGGSPISAQLMQGIINAGGGNRAALITAPQFVGYLVQAYQPSLSGMGDIVYTGSGLSGLGNLYRLG
jgi:hypothetical protein